MKSFKKIMVATAQAASTTIMVATAQAASTTTTIDAYAGLVPVLTVVCAPVKFGVWKVPVRSTGGVTIVSLLRSSDTATASNNTTDVAMSTTAAYLSARGKCDVSGSSATDGTFLLIGVPSTSNTMMSDTAAFILAPPATAISAMTYTLNGPGLNTIAVTGGAATFYIGGILRIPETIVVANYGGYKGDVVEFSVRDATPE